MMNKSAAGSWVRPTSNFVPAPELGRPPGGSSPVIHFFQDQETGARWIGKLGQVPLRDKEVIEAARRLPGFLGVYADEILEKLGLAVYQLLGTEVPESTLSYQQVTMEAMHPDMLLAMQLNAEDEGRVFELPHSPRMHYLSRYVEEFQPLDKDFVEHYLANAKRCGNEYVKIQTRDGEMLPLRGLGSMLAAADFVYDLDCLGDSCGNAGYVIKEDAATGERYAQLVKIDAGYAFSYSDLRTDQRDNLCDRQIRVAPNQLRLQFADLAPIDQREFAATAKRILATPYDEFAHLFSQTEAVNEGISARHWQQLLDELVARKSLFLKAFAPETDRTIVNEIEAAQAKIAKKLQHTEEVSAQTVEEILAQEKEEAIALAELRVRLAVVDVKESQSEKVGECKTFQLPTSNTHFVGREEALAEVVRQLDRANGSVIGQSISGIGGVGKTQLALHFAQAAANGEAIGGQYLGYDYVVWLNAELFLDGQFQAMAELWTGEQMKVDEAIEAVYRYLRGKRTLLVFDNAENARSIAAFLPPARYPSPVHFLITSRNAQWGDLATVKLGGFTLEEAQQYVAYHLGPQSKEAVAKLVELLEGLPLAISQAVSYIKAGHSTLEGFEEQFYLNQASLLSHELLEEEDHPKTVGTTLTLCLAQAKVKNPLVEKFLGVVAYFAAEGIKIGLIQEALEVSKTDLEEALGVLESYSLVSRGAGGLQVHRLVQEVIRHRHKFLQDPHTYWNKVVTLLRGVVVDDGTNIEKIRQCNHAIAHVKQLAELYKKVELNKKEQLALGKLLGLGGAHQITIGNPKVSRFFQEQALEISERHHSRDHVKVANILVNLGVAYGDLGDARKQKELLKRALRIFERHYGKNHPAVAIALTNLGNAYGNLGNTQKKRELLERALNIDQNYYGQSHAELFGTLVNLGNAYGTLGNTYKQKELLERALTIVEDYFGNDHPNVATTLASLGNVYEDLGNALKQKELLERALRIFEEHYGKEHPTVATVLGNLGNAYGDLGDARKQKELLERALIILEAHYGPEHVEVARTLTCLGVAYGDLGDARKREFLERALRIQEAYYGPDHVEVARTLVNLGNAYGDLGDACKKKEVLERALRIQETHYGPDHVQVARTLNNLSIAYGDLGDARKKKELLERALRINETNYSPDHVELAKTLTNLSNAYGALGDARKKKELLERVLRIKEAHYGPDHVEVAATLGKLGIAYGDLDDARKRKELLEHALRIKEAHYGPDHVEVAIELGNLGIAYGALGNARKQKELLERALIIEENHFGKDHPEVAMTLANLGNTYGILGDARKQKEFLERALPILERYYGSDHAKVAITLKSLANTYGALGDACKQKELLERALPILEWHYGPDHPEVAMTLGSLGNAYGSLGDPYKQKEFLERALSIFERQYGKDHPNIAITLASLGDAYGNLGDAHKQREMLERTLAIEKRIETELSYSQAPFLKVVAEWVQIVEEAIRSKQPKVYEPNAARIYVSKALMAIKDGYWGQLLESPSLYGIPREFVYLLEKYKEEHPILANAAKQSNLVMVVCSRLQANREIEKEKVIKLEGEGENRFQQRELLERQLITQEKLYGADHPEVALTLVRLGEVYYILGNKPKGRELLERALRIQEQHFGHEHLKVGKILGKLGTMCAGMGAMQTCQELLERRVAIAEVNYGSDHSKVAKALVVLGNVYGDMGEVRRQKMHLERALQIEEKCYGSNHLKMDVTLINLVYACLNLQEYVDAILYASKVYLIYRRHYGEGDVRTQKAATLLRECEEQSRSRESKEKEDPIEQRKPVKFSNSDSCVVS